MSRTICAAFLLMSSESFDTKQALWSFLTATAGPYHYFFGTGAFLLWALLNVGIDIDNS